jgi:tRNA (guanine-N7-)-methyltransferase
VKQVGGIMENMRAGGEAPTKHANPYLLDALMLQNILLSAPESKEKFPNYFQNTNLPVVLEIGCYLGKSVLEMSQSNPKLNILGLDITYKRVVKSAKKIKLLNLPNARIGICEGRDFLNSLAPNSLTGVCVFFPDPWPKKRQAKNRLVQPEFFESLLQKLKPNGFLWLKTDSEPYFEQTLETIVPEHWAISNPNETPVELTPGTYVTSFEEMFISKELPIYRRVFRKKQ